MKKKTKTECVTGGGFIFSRFRFKRTNGKSSLSKRTKTNEL